MRLSSEVTPTQQFARDCPIGSQIGMPRNASASSPPPTHQREPRNRTVESDPGGMAERTIATVLKTVEASRSPGVRIPLPPLHIPLARRGDRDVRPWLEDRQSE
jgi:hypothetical protein